MAKKVTVERTSKPLKAWSLFSRIVQGLGILFLLAGLANSTPDPEHLVIKFGAWILGIGTVMYVVGRLLVWWHHD